MPAQPRIGFWGNYGFQKPFRALGRWVGAPFPDSQIGQKFSQELSTGILRYHVNVLFDRQKPRREQLEMVLVLDTRDEKILHKMWADPAWQKEDEHDPGTESRLGEAGPPEDSGVDVPW